MTKRILIVCATSIATSTAIAAKIRDFCRENNIKAEVTQGKAGDFMGFSLGSDEERNRYDLIITTVEIPKDKFTAPILQGVPLLSGIGEEALLANIKKILTA